MRCNICNTLCTSSKNTLYNVVTNKFDTVCDTCKVVIKEVGIDYAMADSSYDDMYSDDIHSRYVFNGGDEP